MCYPSPYLQTFPFINSSKFLDSYMVNKEILTLNDDSWHFLSSLIKKPVWRDSSCRQHLRRHLQRPGVPHFVPSRQLLSYIVSHLNTAPSVSGPESVTTLESQLHASHKKTAQSGVKTWLLNSYLPMASYLCPVNYTAKAQSTLTHISGKVCEFLG